MRNNPLLMASSAIYAGAGVPLLFAADELQRRVDGNVSPTGVWMGGMLGGALVAFALLNWFNRTQMIGGIYGRPLLIANLMLLTNIVFPALRVWRTNAHPLPATMAALFGVLLLLFGRLLFRTPPQVGSGSGPR
jgi:hypothetical protein